MTLPFRAFILSAGAALVAAAAHFAHLNGAA